jgi:hypothetical protein
MALLNARLFEIIEAVTKTVADILLEDWGLNVSKQIRNLLGIGLLLVIGTCLGCSRETVFVEDRASLLSADEADRITRVCRKLLQDLDVHIMTVVLEGPPADIDAEAVAVFAAARLGEKTDGARGLLFLVDPAGGRVRLEVGYDLEAVFTDAFVGYIERSQMVPFFQAGRVGPGVEATVELLVGKAMGDDSFFESAANVTLPQDQQHLSGGAGARTDVEIGAGLPDKAPSPMAAAFNARPTPQETLDEYMQVLRLHVKDPELGIYTAETRAFFRNWLVTDAQQDNALKVLRHTRGSARTFVSGDLAVMRYPVADRQASPFFFRRGAQGWMLDFATMSRTIGFNHKNQWFFRTTDHPFMFAFEDLILDRHGFPHPRRG